VGLAVWLSNYRLRDGTSKKGPLFGEPFLILRTVRHQESKKLVTN